MKPGGFSWGLDMDNGKAYVAINGVWGTVTVPATNDVRWHCCTCRMILWSTISQWWYL